MFSHRDQDFVMNTRKLFSFLEDNFSLVLPFLRQKMQGICDKLTALSVKGCNNGREKSKFATAARFVTECLAVDDPEDAPANVASEVGCVNVRRNAHCH